MSPEQASRLRARLQDLQPNFADRHPLAYLALCSLIYDNEGGGVIVETLEAETRESLQTKIDKYLVNYHPMGYGTRVRSTKEVDGVWMATGSRFESCD